MKSDELRDKAIALQQEGRSPEAVDLLIGEIRDLELERNKHELDAAHWKERYEDAVRALETVNTVTGKER